MKKNICNLRAHILNVGNTNYYVYKAIIIFHVIVNNLFVVFDKCNSNVPKVVGNGNDQKLMVTLQHCDGIYVY